MSFLSWDGRWPKGVCLGKQRAFIPPPPISYLEGTLGTENHSCGANLERIFHNWLGEDVACLLEPLRLSGQYGVEMRLFTQGLHVSTVSHVKSSTRRRACQSAALSGELEVLKTLGHIDPWVKVVACLLRFIKIMMTILIWLFQTLICGCT